LTDDARDLDKQSPTPGDSGNLNSSVAGASSDSPAVGIAICDDQLRYVSVNHALAAMNGIPAEVHIGKTVREVIGKVASSVESMLRCVLFNGESILNAEIRGYLPTRDGEGCWIEHYFPVRYANGGVKQVGVVVVEITALRRLEDCILALTGSTGRMREQPTDFGMPYGLKKASAALGSGSIESVENLIREGLKNPHKLQPPAQNIANAVTPQRVRLPYAPSAIPNETYRHNHGLTPTGSNGAKQLSPRETQLVQLLAKGRSNKEISTACKISVKTVEAHRARLMLKLQIHSLSDLVLYAVRCGLVKV
jgi:PAS domain S-box-containing protein